MAPIISRVVRAVRPVDPEFAAALARRWAGLPETARTPGQVLGRHAVGCEGTHGVFPQCNLACTPCYHSRDANQVRVDGPHTLAQITGQMTLLRQHRGPRAHAQLIGGEVSLLDPDDHAAALQVMRGHGREPMSFTHGDVDYDYLRRLVLGPDGRARLRRVFFAAHFDSLMFGRRGIPRPPDEASLNPYRQRFTAMFARLRAEHGVRSFLTHNMTVTPANLGQVAEVVRDCRAMGFGMFSFQPAAFVGDERRWHEDYRDLTGDQVWAQIERGAGTRLDSQVFEHGDVRCNRAAYGFWAGDRWYPFLDGEEPRPGGAGCVLPLLRAGQLYRHPRTSARREDSGDHRPSPPGAGAGGRVGFPHGEAGRGAVAAAVTDAGLTHRPPWSPVLLWHRISNSVSHSPPILAPGVCPVEHLDRRRHDRAARRPAECLR
jgi:hypothetical protein